MRVDPAKNREYQAKWYKQNRETHYARIKERERKIAQWLQEHKATLSCEECGQNHPATLDFHHKNPKEKDVNIAQAVERGWGKQRILNEIAKCRVLCSNCHRILHWEERRRGASR